jgi:rare lipoprotein A
MPSIGSTGNSYVGIGSRRTLLDPSLLLSTRFPKTAGLFATALTSMLTACAQPAVLASRSELLAVSRPAPLQDGSRFVLDGHKVVTSERTPLVTNTHAAATRFASYGLASFYSYGGRTASGEKFDPHELTAAHPTLPFGTRLRVTSVATGRSVIVRVNDRGPFLPGRVVDVSSAAAETLGIVGQGTAKVKLDVLH